MTASAGKYTVDVVPDLNKLAVAAEILASLCDGIAHEMRSAVADLDRLTATSIDEPIDLIPTGLDRTVRRASHVTVPIAGWTSNGHPMVKVRAAHRDLILEVDEYRTTDDPRKTGGES